MAGNELSTENDGVMSSINITPFVDVVLVLLVIFMVTAPLLVKEVLDLQLPKTVSGDGQVTQTLGIAVNRSGQILLNGQLIEENAFREEIRKVVARSPATQAIIAADLEVPYGRVVKVIDWLKSEGLNQFAVQVERENQ